MLAKIVLGDRKRRNARVGGANCKNQKESLHIKTIGIVRLGRGWKTTLLA